MAWVKSVKEYLWQDIASDIICDKIVVAMTRTVIRSVLTEGYINDGNDLHRLVGWIKPIVEATRDDLVDLRPSDKNKINNVIGYMGKVETGVIADNQANLATACNFIYELIQSSGYTLENI